MDLLIAIAPRLASARGGRGAPVGRSPISPQGSSLLLYINTKREADRSLVQDVEAVCHKFRIFFRSIFLEETRPQRPPKKEKDTEENHLLNIFSRVECSLVIEDGEQEMRARTLYMFTRFW